VRVSASASASLLGVACSLGQGQGQIETDLLAVEGCWNGPFRLDPDFFAAQPYRRTLNLRIQHGGDIEEVSDGATILVDDIDRVRTAIGDQGGSAEFRVAQPPNVVAPGYPVVVDNDPAIVHLTLYLHRACHAQNSALYAVDGRITFRSLFNGNLRETDPTQKLTDAEFSDIVVADPRDRAIGGGAIQNVSHLRGNLRFYFERGQPAQPFP
jgi:hypothetical protein